MPYRADIPKDVLANIANDLVRLKAQYYGKGPTEAKAFINDETLVVVLKGGLTTVERTLLGAGEFDLVRSVRLKFQQAMGQAFVDAVQRAADVHVLTYMSQIVFDPEYTYELFVLGEPEEASAMPNPDIGNAG
jgi:uncharacterized protein YbcI